MGKKKILVTGASGFIGKFLIKELIKNKNNHVIGVYNNSNYLSLKKEFGKKVDWLKIDLVKDNLANVLPDVDLVYHLSGYYTSSSNSYELTKLKKINLIGTKKLATAYKSLKIKQFIFISSIAACELSKDSIINEENGLPQSLYGKIKKKTENELFRISKGSYNVTVLRPTAIFGEHHKGTLFEIAKIIKKIKFVKFGSDVCYTNFYYVRDFVNLLVRIALQKQFFNKVFIAADKPHKLETIIFEIQNSLNYEKRIYFLPLWLGYIFAATFELIFLIIGRYKLFSFKRLTNMNNKVQFSNKKITKLLSINNQYGVLKGIVRTIRWYKEMRML